MNIDSVRIWYRIRDWNSTQPDNWFIDRVKQYHNAGIKVLLTVLSNRSTDYNTSKRYFQNLAGREDLRSAVSLWQIGNEVNHGPFWQDSMENYVNNMLKPASEVLRGYGAKIIGSSTTGAPADAVKLRNLGVMNYIDYAAYHPYADTADEIIRRAREVANTYAGKPIIFTEWNLVVWGANSMFSSPTMQQDLERVRREFKSIAAAHYFHAMINDGTINGVYHNAFNYTPNDTVLNEVRSWRFE